MSNIDIIAFYLPQYHPTPHNNEWWGEGFTEWTNVAKAKALYPGHYQPKIPADLGFYDLRLPLVRIKQAELAREAGISGFCYYHYWFGGGNEELELPFDEVVKSGSPDFPFCLCWANESWSKKFWNKDGVATKQSKMLIEQQYLGEEDDIKHFYRLLPAFKDKRYMKIDGKLIFMIYKPLLFVNVTDTIKLWNELAKKEGLDGFFFIGYTINITEEYHKIKKLGFDAVTSCRLNRNSIKGFGWFFRKLISVVFHTPRRMSYSKAIKRFVGMEEKESDVFPTLIPNWDHTPRSGINGDLLTNSTPNLFEKHVDMVLDVVKSKPCNRRIVFLKSWNEWGEGNYMEPDLKFGKGYIWALSKMKNKYNI